MWDNKDTTWFLNIHINIVKMIVPTTLNKRWINPVLLAFTEVPIELFNKTNSLSYLNFVPYGYQGQARKISDTQIGVRQTRVSGADANGKVFIYGIK